MIFYDKNGKPEEVDISPYEVAGMSEDGFPIIDLGPYAMMNYKLVGVENGQPLYEIYCMWCDNFFDNN